MTDKPAGLVPDDFIFSAPHPQTTLDLMRDQWTTRIPIPGTQSGPIALFDDARIHWAAARLGGFGGRRLLELGPLEGAHTATLEALGAREIVAVEANKRAFLKCLLVKELLGLARVRFLLGDIMAYLETATDCFDAVIACGVLYHMPAPLKMLALAARRSTRLFVWTHYFDAEKLRRFGAAWADTEPVPQAEAGFACTGHLHRYGAALDLPTFCGGIHPTTTWLEKADILAFIEHLGFTSIETGGDDNSHPNGPALSIAARR